MKQQICEAERGEGLRDVSLRRRGFPSSPDEFCYLVVREGGDEGGRGASREEAG